MLVPPEPLLLTCIGSLCPLGVGAVPQKAHGSRLIQSAFRPNCTSRRALRRAPRLLLGGSFNPSLRDVPDQLSTPLLPLSNQVRMMEIGEAAANLGQS